MRKNGFTLIELLAVIVILAIIALIATPIILGIINDAREKANERSVELYASAVRNAVAAYQLTGTSAPKSFSDLTIEYDGNVVCATEELYEDGSFYLEGCKVNDGDKEYSYGTKKERAVSKACTLADTDDDGIADVGEVVTCELSESTDKFYVIEEANLSTATEVKMLTEKNIHTTNYRQSDNAGYLYFSSTNYWSNDNFQMGIPFDVYDERNDIVKPIVDEYVNYLSTKLINVRGNLLTYSQANKLGCVFDLDNEANSICLSSLSWVYSTNYWLGSIFASEGGIRIHHTGKISPCYYQATADPEYSNGVRPVITMPTSNIK